MQELKDKTKEQLIEEVESLYQRITELEELETESEHVEEALRDSDERYRKLIQQSVEAIYMFDPETKRILEANTAFLNFLGYTAEEVQTLTLYDFVVHKRDSIDAYIQHILMSGAITIGERLWRRKDKTLIDVRVTASKIQQGGRYICFVVARDITERKRVEEELRRSKEMLENIAQGITEGIMLLSKDYKVLWANKATIEGSGYGLGEILGNYCCKVTHHRDGPCEPPLESCPIYELQKTGKPVTLTHTHFDKGGNKIFVEVSAYPVRDEKGEIAQFIYVSKDITERKRAEEEIKKLNEKLNQRVVELEVINEELMTFSHSALDELGAPLRSIDGFSRVLLQDYAERLDEQGKDYLQRVRAATQRMAQLIDNLLNLSRAIHGELDQE